MQKKVGFALGLCAGLALLALFVAPVAHSEIPTHTRVTPQRGEVGATGITGYTIGTAKTILTTTADTAVLLIENTSDAPYIVTRAGTDFKRVPAGNFRAIDLKTSSVSFGPATWGAHGVTGTTGTAGQLEIIAIPHR